MPIISGPGYGNFKTSHGTYMIPYGYNRLNYTQAESFCQIAGAQIAAFETVAEYQAVKTALIAATVIDQYWLNGNDRRQDGNSYKNKKSET